MQTSIPDNVLMTQVQQGHSEVMGVLFDRYHRVLFQFFFNQNSDRFLSEDLVQTVFLRILTYAHSFRGEGEFKQWMFFIARNVNRDHHKKRGRWKREKIDSWQDHFGEEPTQATKMESEEEMEQLRQALEQLPQNQRELLVMSKLQGMKYKQIGSILGCSEGAVKVKVYRALKALKQVYSQIESK
ncbi:MAG: RNA polymerase sigma factor [Bacteroidota bacterium]